MKQQVIELLAPARDAETAIEAIKHGADAVYIGAPSYGARAAATNSVDDIRRVAEYAHRFNARVYVTLNTLIYDSETADVEGLVQELYDAGVDALIVQDLGLLRMHLPSTLALHASTQCDTRDATKVAFLHGAGFNRVVVAREMSIDEIAQVHREVPDVEIEAFVHGALCVCYSGDCRASLATTGRSANRGECAQICRYSFNLIDGNGHRLVTDKHLLSLRDMNRSARVAEMMAAGVNSFKIEGRLKDTAYVKNVTAHYRKIIDEVIAANPERYRRASQGRSDVSFAPDAKRSFNRGFTEYFADGRPAGNQKMASIDTPKWRGLLVATVKGRDGKALVAETKEPLHNGDGLGYFDASGRFSGFRLNRVEGGRLYPAGELNIKPGTRLYRNFDKAYIDTLAADTATRTIATALTLRLLPDGSRIALDAADERGCSVTVTAYTGALDKARTPQEEARRRTLSKTGGTIYRIEGITDHCGDAFIPASTLAGLRRNVIEALDSAQRAIYQREQRSSEDADMRAPAHLTFHDNVSNRYARKFYSDHGTTDIEPAAEVSGPMKPGSEVMCTRYCLRRELGRCLKTPEGRQWQEPLTLESGANRFMLRFDCKECRMRVLLK